MSNAFGAFAPHLFLWLYYLYFDANFLRLNELIPDAGYFEKCLKVLAVIYGVI
jgi:hypothetical protein